MIGSERAYFDNWRDQHPGCHTHASGLDYHSGSNKIGPECVSLKCGGVQWEISPGRWQCDTCGLIIRPSPKAKP